VYYVSIGSVCLLSFIIFPLVVYVRVSEQHQKIGIQFDTRPKLKEQNE